MRGRAAAAARTVDAPLLAVRRLSLDGALRELDFNLYEAERLAILAPGGCGKSTLAQALVGFTRAHAGSIRYEGRELAQLDKAQWRGLRRQIQLLLQDAAESLDPRMRIVDSVAEPLMALYPAMPAAERNRQAAQMLERLGLARELQGQRPRKLAQPQRIRAALARALVLKPRLLIWDEPALADASAQDALNRTLRELQAELGFALLVLTRDPLLARELGSRTLAMWRGRVMESAETATLFARPMHPCTQRLLGEGFASVPLELPPSGCVFRLHCPLADAQCADAVPVMRRTASGSFAACHHVAAAVEPHAPELTPSSEV